MSEPTNRDVDPAPEGGYSEAEELPAIRRIEANLRAARLFTGIADSVNGYYRLLPGLGWIFLGRFNVNAVIDRAIANQGAQLEAGMVAWFSAEANLRILVMRAKAMPELSGRGSLLDLALQDTLAGRYYAATLVLLAVTDGLISDIDRGHRQGLHARDPDQMVAWGSPAGHRLGLPAALKSYQTPIGKVREGEVVHLYRHGIVHGMVPHFNNATVSGKAWNLLGALIDWAQAEEEGSKLAPTSPIWTEVTARVERSRRTAATLAGWTSRSWSEQSGPDVSPSEPVVEAVRELFDGWQLKRWAIVGSRIDSFAPPASAGKLAAAVKARFEPALLQSWTLTSWEFVGPMAVDVSCTAILDGFKIHSRTKWFYKGADGGHLNEFEPGGTWRCIQESPAEILRVPHGQG